MAWSEDLERFRQSLRTKRRDVVLSVVRKVKQSVVEGSSVTGSPGQPVQTGFLKGSWDDFEEADWIWLVATNAEYAPSIEDGLQEPYERADGTVVTPSPMTLRSEVGGFHSVKLTRAGFEKIVREALREVVDRPGSFVRPGPGGVGI